MRLAVVFALGAAGGAVFAAVGLPAAFLSGSMVVVAAAALLGLDAKVPVRLRDGIYVLLGVSMAGGIDRDLLARLGEWPPSLAGLAVSVIAMIAGSYLYLRRVAGWDAPSAFFGSIPGALSMTLATAEASRADIRRVALSQTLRLFMLVGVLPLVVTAVDPAASAPPPTPAVEGIGSLALLLATGLAGAAAGHFARVPAGILLGAFVASGLLHGFGVVGGALPPALLVPAMVGLGAMLGLRFAGTSPRLLVATLTAGIGAFLTAFAMAVAGAVAVSVLTGIDLSRLLIAYAPGGLEVMVILAFALDVDPAFVAAHHLARFVAMTALVPLLARLVLGAGWASPREPVPRESDFENEVLPDDPDAAGAVDTSSPP
nr:AbrB family transcriptional regulator [Oharaeibacter diazotrophicus]